jgi:nucleotide-binding universal stress UspA family protein
MLPVVRKILYCTDLSETAINAARYALLLAKVTGADIHIFHVVGELTQDAKITLKSHVQDSRQLDKILRSRVDIAKGEIARRMETLEPDEQELMKQVKSVDIREGFPVEAILKKIGDDDYDLVVMGTHEKGFAQSFLGSVAKTVLRSSNVPVVVVPLPAS